MQKLFIDHINLWVNCHLEENVSVHLLTGLKVLNCSKLKKHWLTNPKENKNGRISSFTLLLLFSSVVLLVAKLVFVLVPGQGLRALLFGRAHLSHVFSESQTLQLVAHLPMAGAVRGVSLVINID